MKRIAPAIPKKEPYLPSIFERNPGPFTEAILAYHKRLYPSPFAGYRGGAIVVNHRTEKPNRDERRRWKRTLHVLDGMVAASLPASRDRLAEAVRVHNMDLAGLRDMLANWSEVAYLYD